jgi:hypothetical protein
VLNDSDRDVEDIDWEIRRLGPGAPAPISGTIPLASAHTGQGDGHDHAVDVIENDRGQTHTYQITLDPDNRIAEADEDNNTYLFVIDVPDDSTPSRVGDLEFRTAHFHALRPGATHGFHFEAHNTSGATMSGARWRLRCADLGVDLAFDLDPIPAGSFIDTSTTLEITDNGEHRFQLILDSGDAVIETNEDNNQIPFTIVVAHGGSG